MTARSIRAEERAAADRLRGTAGLARQQLDGWRAAILAWGAPGYEITAYDLRRMLDAIDSLTAERDEARDLNNGAASRLLSLEARLAAAERVVEALIADVDDPRNVVETIADETIAAARAYQKAYSSNGATSSYIERLERLVDAGDDLADFAAMTIEEAKKKGQRMMLLERAVSIYRETSKTENALSEDHKEA